MKSGQRQGTFNAAATGPASQNQSQDRSQQHARLGEELLAAVEHGDIAAAAELLERGANVDYTNLIGWTALLKAAEKDHKEMVDFLLAQNATVDLESDSGWSPLHMAAGCAGKDVIHSLVKAGADINSTTGVGWSAMHVAATGDITDNLTTLIELGGDVNVTSASTEWTPLISAASKGKTEAIALLLKNDARIDAQDTNGMTALHQAIYNNAPDTAISLIRHGAGLTPTNSEGHTPLELNAGHIEAETITTVREYVSLRHAGLAKQAARRAKGHRWK